MNYIKRLKIHGFKKFKDFEICFNEGKNIIIGDNESGKSTLLDALNVILWQKYKNYDKYIIRELLNQQEAEEFTAEPKFETLPSILIEIELGLDATPNNGLFYGMNHSFEKNKGLYGISFRCELSEEFKTDGDVLQIIQEGRIPYEYYQLAWYTFQGETYKLIKKPLKYLAIDCDNTDAIVSYNYYYRTLFSANHNNIEQSKIKDDFRAGVHQVFSNLGMNNIGDSQSFGVNDKKIILENIITVLDNGISIESKGKGKENMIKTEIAIERAGSPDVLSIEEPETHLSFPNLRKMLAKIQEVSNSQLIATTHESMIVSGLGVENALWIKDNCAESLSQIPRDDATFFMKAPSNNLLQFILSDKVILVEGPTEFMLIPTIFKKVCDKSPDEAGVNIISCDGVSYDRYLSIARQTGKRVAIITDNDAKQDNLDKMASMNNSEYVHIFMDSSLDNWTWEVCFYNLNKTKLEKEIKVRDGAQYLFNQSDYEQVLGKMLNNKVETAYDMLSNGGADFDYTIPPYIEEACKWINEYS